ncbi:MAG: hypothetical protein AAF318_16735 [Pseudomonadota bacterium]
MAAGRQGPPVHSKLGAHEAFTLALVEADRDITLTEIAERLRSDRGVEASRALVWYFFDKRSVTFTKKTAHAAEQDRSTLSGTKMSRTLRFSARSGSADNSISTRLIFIDETGTNTKMARPRGRAPRGRRCRPSVPRGHWKTTTFTAGICVGWTDRPVRSRRCDGR